MLKFVNKDNIYSAEYPAAFVQAAVEAFLNAGHKPEEYGDHGRMILAIDTPRGKLTAQLSANDGYNSLWADLETVDEDGSKLDIPLATIEVPEDERDAIQENWGFDDAPKGEPRIYLYEDGQDEVSHLIVPGPNGMKIGCENGRSYPAKRG